MTLLTRGLTGTNLVVRGFLEFVVIGVGPIQDGDLETILQEGAIEWTPHVDGVLVGVAPSGQLLVGYQEGDPFGEATAGKIAAALEAGDTVHSVTEGGVSTSRSAGKTTTVRQG